MAEFFGIVIALLIGIACGAAAGMIKNRLQAKRSAPEKPKQEVLPPEPDSTPVKCTYCGGTKFFEGPSGGMSTNILCANDKCRHWFNWTPFINVLDDLKRVEPEREA
jgi:hypothetical protein